MNIRTMLAAGAAIPALLTTSCTFNWRAAPESAPFPDPVTVSQSRCSGLDQKPNAPVASVAEAFAFDFDTAYALPDSEIEPFHFAVTTTSAEAQRWFDTGLAHMSNFNHDEAIAAFREAQALDPDCAMCFWGEGLSFGSNINAPFDPVRGAAGRQAAARASELAAGATEKEAALIQALGARYAANEKGVAVETAERYAEHMAQAASIYEDDPFVLSLAAEANMDTQPWNYWAADGRQPIGRTQQTIQLLERALALNPDFMPAIHLYIHATEASIDPYRAEAFADRLSEQAGVAGHLVHMPSHIYFRIGKWKKSLAANIDAIAVDEAYIANSENALAYEQVYYIHNVHFVVSTAQMAGDGQTALAMTEKLSQAVQLDPDAPAPWSEHIAGARYFSTLQFADEDAFLGLPEPSEAHLFLRMAWRFGRGEIFARRGDVEAAQVELADLKSLAEAPMAQDYDAVGVPFLATLEVAIASLQAHMHQAEGDMGAAIDAMDDAVALQAALPYMEPAWWYYPARQTLAAMLLKDGQHDRAVREFYKTLIESPNNAYALYGLAEAYKAMGNARSEDYARHLFEEAWAGDAEKAPDLSRL